MYSFFQAIEQVQNCVEDVQAAIEMDFEPF